MSQSKGSQVTRRKRLVIITIFSTVFFLLVLGAIYFFSSPEEETYRPGEHVEGLTDDLGRKLPEDYPKVTFTDVSAQAGIDYRHFHGKRSTQLPEDMGSGVAWGDYDNDGWEDLFIANQAGPLDMPAEELASSPARCALYHNNGDGTFSEVAEVTGLAIRGQVNAAAWADYDRDGWLDIVVSSLGQNRLFHNDEGSGFTEMTSSSGMGIDRGYWAGINWGDFNNDGWLDLYVCGYVKYTRPSDNQKSLQVDAEVPTSLNPSSFKPERNLLFRNNKDGTFTEMAANAGVDNLTGRSLAAAWFDVNEDGWQDLYVANDVSDNMLYLNKGDGTFEDISLAALVADYRGAMGIAVADWDNDTDLDMFITHWIAQENALYNNSWSRDKGPEKKIPRFMDEADRYGLGQIALDFIGFGTSFLDYDNDGYLDIFIANGSTFQQRDSTHLLVSMKDQLFWNRHSKEGFFDVSRVSGDYFSKEFVGRGSAHADFDNDGDLDIFIVNNNGPGILLRNDGGNQKNWIQVSLEGKRSNPQAIGAIIRVYTGDVVQTRAVGAQGSYFSQHGLTEHFGLNDKTVIDSLTISWPDGSRQKVTGLEGNKRHHVKEQ